jgi:outer membrane lipoprotein-sorting protein
VSIFDRRPRLRWAVPAAAGALILSSAAVGTVIASADAGLPPRTAQELLVDLQDPQTDALSGTVVASADLGLPALPTGMGSSADLTSLVSGSHTLRVWSDGPDRARLAMIGSSEETDVIRNGRDVWVWASDGDTVDHYVLPERDPAQEADTIERLPDLPRTPQEAATLVLEALDESTEVTTAGAARVAGRSAYELVLTPKQSDTLVSRVVIAVDAEMKVPLRVQVFSTELPGPAYEVGFTSVDFGAPDAELFAFTPPSGATVTDHSAEDMKAEAGSGPAKPDASLAPTVVGTGWSQVVIAQLPADLAAGAVAASEDSASASPMTGLDAAALLESLPRVSGEWGTGRVLSGTLVSAILTDDGRVAIGAVGPQALGAALAAQ